MLRRFSTKVGLSKGRKQDTDDAPRDATNGVVNGAGRPTQEKRKSTFGPLKALKKEEEAPDHSASRVEVEGSFNQFAQLLQAARRPLPNQSGDGAYLEHTEPNGLRAILRSSASRMQRP